MTFGRVRMSIQPAKLEQFMADLAGLYKNDPSDPKIRIRGTFNHYDTLDSFVVEIPRRAFIRLSEFNARKGLKKVYG